MDQIIYDKLVTVPQVVQDYLRNNPCHWRNTLNQVDQETWVTTESVGYHTDSTLEGLVVYGCVLVNDANDELFVWDGEVRRDFPLPVGTLYRIDGHSPHGTRRDPAAAVTARFGVLVWDMPPDWGFERFEEDLISILFDKEKAWAT